VSPKVRDLIPRMSLAKLGGEPFVSTGLSQGIVAKYIVGPRKPPSKTWHTFLKNYILSLAGPSILLSGIPELLLHNACLQFGTFHTKGPMAPP
jgi:hypothetical protein